MQKKENKLCKKSSTSSAAHEYNGVSQGDTPSPPLGGGGKGLSFIITRLRSRRQDFLQKKIIFFSHDFSRLLALSVIETLQKKVKKNR